MIEFLQNLEPRQELEDQILIQELDEFTEVLFFNSGSVDIGYQINKLNHFVLRRKNGIVIGDHEVTFNHRSSFIYKIHSLCEGYSIRKNNWFRILEEFPELYE